jgi:HK97 family phage portal protein
MAGGLFGALTRGAQIATRGVAGESESFWNGYFWSAPSATGIQINQQTALQATAVMACVRILSEDVSKMTPRLFRRYDKGIHKNGARAQLASKEHPLAALLVKPNGWQTWPEYCRQMVIAFALRGNAYSVILRNRRGDPVMFVPINPDRVALWQSPDGGLFFWVSRSGLHELHVLRDVPLLVPYEDMFHLKDLSADGLVGTSPIALAREAIGLSLAQEQQYARLMGNGARPSGVLSTEQRLTDASAARLRADWENMNAGLANAGRTAILEQGLKWTPLTISSVDLQFLQMRKFQVEEICRIFRVPPHMVGVMERGGLNNIVQQAQDYQNNTLTSHTDIWEKRFAFTFDLEDGVEHVDLDKKALLKADLTARYNAHRVGVLTGWDTRNEVRIEEGKDPLPDLDEPLYPSNEMGASGIGSDLGGENPGAGKASDNLAIDNQPITGNS